MAERPKTMARSIAELCDGADAVARGVFFVLPRQYLDRPEPTDPISVAWNDALRTATLAKIKLEELSKMLHEKAGLKYVERRERTAAVMAGDAVGAAETARKRSQNS